MLHHQGLPFVLEAIQMELINWHHDGPLTGNFGIKKIYRLLARKYYWPTLRHDVKAYVKDCDIYLAFKTIQHKPYSDLQSLLLPTY